MDNSDVCGFFFGRRTGCRILRECSKLGCWGMAQNEDIDLPTSWVQVCGAWHSNYEAMGIYVLGFNSLISMVGDGNEHHSMGLYTPINQKVSILKVGIRDCQLFFCILFLFCICFLVNKTTFNQPF